MLYRTDWKSNRRRFANKEAFFKSKKQMINIRTGGEYLTRWGDRNVVGSEVRWGGVEKKGRMVGGWRERERGRRNVVESEGRREMENEEDGGGGRRRRRRRR